MKEIFPVHTGISFDLHLLNNQVRRNLIVNLICHRHYFFYVFYFRKQTMFVSISNDWISKIVFNIRMSFQFINGGNVNVYFLNRTIFSF